MSYLNTTFFLFSFGSRYCEGDMAIYLACLEFPNLFEKFGVAVAQNEKIGEVRVSLRGEQRPS
jgi:hypothetical protein